MDALEAIARRHSSRNYLDTPVLRETLDKILDAGRRAATANNDQPWEFVVICDGERRRKLAELTTYGRFIAQAPVCVIVFCRATWGYLEDGSAATQNMLVAAAALGVQSCWIGGDKAAYCSAVEKFAGIPSGYKLVSLISFGYEAAAPTPRNKRELKEIVHWEKW